MRSTHYRIAAALALLLTANITLVLVCELRCDVPARAPASAVACHGPATTAAMSEVIIADGGHDQCEHDALPAVTIAAIKKDVRVTSVSLTGSTHVGGLVPALKSDVRTHRTASLRDDHSTRTVLRI